ncbi:MAG: hypothetical protein R3E18_12490 [Sphingomonadaceae bacterium]|nr:hypothetical protein [Sphingomonadaceae bacterium]
MARARKKQTNTKMYHHFAAVTVGATLLLAIFSDGENRKHMEKIATDTDQALYGDKLGKSEIRRRNPQPASSYHGSGDFGSEGGDFGAPMDSTGASGSDSSYIPDIPAGAVPAGVDPRYGVSEEELAKLSEEQKADLLKRIREGRFGKSKEERAQQIAKLREASRIRSGAPANTGD